GVLGARFGRVLRLVRAEGAGLPRWLGVLGSRLGRATLGTRLGRGAGALPEPSPGFTPRPGHRPALATCPALVTCPALATPCPGPH
ncbi:hypothetical protein ACIP4Q_25730, partial [Streptomyces massasporeus]